MSHINVLAMRHKTSAEFGQFRNVFSGTLNPTQSNPFRNREAYFNIRDK